MYLLVLSNVVAADTLIGNGVGGRMAAAPHYIMKQPFFLETVHCDTAV